MFLTYCVYSWCQFLVSNACTVATINGNKAYNYTMYSLCKALSKILGDLIIHVTKDWNPCIILLCSKQKVGYQVDNYLHSYHTVYFDLARPDVFLIICIKTSQLSVTALSV